MPALNVVKKFFPKVTIVVDAHHRAVIEVTKADAASKAVKDHSACAMAVACQRKFKLDGVIISRSVAYLVKGKQARRFMLPPSVEREITSFDRGGGVRSRNICAVGSPASIAIWQKKKQSGSWS